VEKKKFPAKSLLSSGISWSVSIKSRSDFNLAPNLSNSLLIPCSKLTLGDFGQNSVTQQLLGQNSLHFSLFFYRNVSEASES
jgi:hypothetical protein